MPDNASHLTYQFNNGVPNQLTQRATPLYRAERQKLDLGIYVQDKWTVKRLTLSGGLRFDTFQSYFPEQTLVPGALVPNRNLTFPKTDMANWKDIVPRLGSVYDLRGNGKTALKVSLNKYVTAQGLQGTYGDTANPVNRLANIVTRSWVDGNRNFVPDCDLTNVFVQDFRPSGGDLCGTVSDTNFGKPTLSLNYNPEVLNGWGIAAVSVGVLDERAARIAARGSRWTSATSVAGSELRRHRQSQSRSRRLRCRSA